MNINTYLNILGDYDATENMKWGALAKALRMICESQKIDIEYDPLAKGKGNWVEERSSGYLGYRCTKCGTWRHTYDPLRCVCDE